jgi:hypothetical protein
MGIPFNAIDIFKYPLKSVKNIGKFPWTRTRNLGAFRASWERCKNQVEQKVQGKTKHFSTVHCIFW